MELTTYIVFYFLPIPNNTVAQYLDSRPEIRNWYLYGTILVILSYAPVKEIQNVLLGLFYNQAFIVTPIQGETTGGNMPLDFWKFINEPKDSGHWPPLTQQLSSPFFGQQIQQTP